MIYNFFITTASSIVYEVTPLNWLECSLLWEKENDEIFYRQKFQGSLTFGGKKLCVDYNLFYDLELTDPCEYIYLLILRDGDVYWEGYFSTSMGEWDHDNQTFTVTPLVVDDYTLFDQEGDTAYSILTQSANTVFMTYNGVAYAFTRCRKLMDFIEYVADQICPGATVTSTFLNNAYNDVTKGTNHYDKLYIAQKSDIKRWDSSNAALVADMSWNELMDLLKTMNLAWTYDESTNIVTIEHVSWTGFVGLAGSDIRTQLISLRNNKYTYTKEDLPKYEKFNWMESGNDEFLQGVISYDSMCVNQDPKSNIRESSWNVTTDIQYICDCINPASALYPDLVSNISDEGFVLLACKEPFFLEVWQTNRPMNNIYFNCDLGWGILFNALFKHERMQIEGYMKGILTDFYSAVKYKRQPTAMICCDTFDPSKYITTELGETYFAGTKGYVETATMNPDGLIKLQLLYGEPENENTGFVYGKGIVVTEVYTGGPPTTTYTAVLTEAAIGDLHLLIRLLVENTTANCITAWFDLTILDGATTGNVAVPWCTPVGGCPCRISIHQWDDSGLGTWDWSVVYDSEVFVY